MLSLEDKALVRSIEAASAGTYSALLRAKKKKKKRVVSESAMPIMAGSELEGPKVKVVLITEGLGNRRDMNYYGPEALASAPSVFEGAHCFLNHPSYTEERDIPERRVQDMCGYFKNVRVESLQGVRTVTGELHFDLSETGRMGFDKTLTALHYKTEFPGSDKEYVGLSVNADGISEPKDIVLDGEVQEVNYVTQFTAAMSCDIVTLPARGGKFLALVESAAGADMRKKEVKHMLVTELQAAQSDLKEAMAIVDPAKRTQKLEEAQGRIDGILKDVLESQARRNKESDAEESETEETKESEESEEAADTSGGPTTIVTKKHTIVKKGSAAPKSGDDDADADDECAESKTEEATDMESDAMEANRLAVKQLIQESGLDASYFDVVDLTHGGLKEAKKEIARVKRISEANYKKMVSVMADVVPSHAAKLNESGKPGKTADNSDLFKGCTL